MEHPTKYILGKLYTADGVSKTLLSRSHSTTVSLAPTAQFSSSLDLFYNHDHIFTGINLMYNTIFRRISETL